MSSRTLNRKQFLVFTASAAAASALAACGDDTPDPGGASGSGSGGTAGSGTAGSGTSGTGTSGSGTGGSAGSGTSGSSTGGSAAGSGGSAAGSGGSAAGSGGSGGSSGGSGGSGGGGGTGGGGGGGMCGTVSTITQTSDELHDHIPSDQAMLKMNLKTFINTAVADMTEFTVPSDGVGGGHIHKFKLSAQQLTMLKGGGMVTGIVTTEDDDHTHTYTIACMA